MAGSQARRNPLGRVTGAVDDARGMADPTTTSDDVELHLTCRRLLFREGRPEADEPPAVCADLCRTPVGAIALLDCPVWQGLECRFYERREGEPEPLTEAELEEHRDDLRADYLRWKYWRRVGELRPIAGDEEVPPPEAGTEDEAPRPVREIPARPEAAGSRRKQRFPGDAPSGPPPVAPSEVDLDHLPEIAPTDAPESPEGEEKPAGDGPRE
jgi:hypothetical protein